MQCEGSRASAGSRAARRDSARKVAQARHVVAVVMRDDHAGDVGRPQATRGELRDAFASTIPPADVDGLRRRTRALMGRCQGFYCGAEVTRLLDEHAGTTS